MIKRCRTEKLKMLLPLKEASESREAAFGSVTIGLHPKKGAITYFEALAILVETMQVREIPDTFIEGRKRVSAEALLKRIGKEGKWGHLETADLSFQFGIVAAYGFCFIEVEEKIAGAAGFWDHWAQPFISMKGFIQAWVADVEYDHWQNAKDPLLYRAAGLDYSHLPMKSNGLLPPLEQMEIDISGNPGRWSLQHGYMEAIGAVMWLGNSFWSCVGEHRKEQLLSAKWVNVNHPAEGVMRIQVAEVSFADQKTKAVQDLLRSILYN